VEGYDEADDTQSALEPRSYDELCTNDDIPIIRTDEYYGSCDMTGGSMSAESRVWNALKNLAPDAAFFPGEEEALPIRISDIDEIIDVPYSNSIFSNEYSGDYLLLAFPTLFPFGVGSFNDSGLSFAARTRHSLLQGTRYFARHMRFSLVVFNIIQNWM